MGWSIQTEAQSNVAECDILKLVALSLGENWTTRSSHQLRLGSLHYKTLSLLAFLDEKLVGTLRIWPIQAGSAGDALLLGPLAIIPELQGQGLGKEMLLKVIDLAGQEGHGAIILVGDAPYYERVGFSAKPTWAMRMPGRYDQNRLLAVELKPGYLSSKEGVVSR